MFTTRWQHRIPLAQRPSTRRWAVSLWPALVCIVVWSLGALGALGHAALAGGAAPATAADRSPSQHLAAGLEAFRRGDIEAAAKAWQEAVRVAAEAKQPQAHSRALTHLAQAYAALGHYGEAAHSLQAALKLAEHAGDRMQVAIVRLLPTSLRET